MNVRMAGQRRYSEERRGRNGRRLVAERTGNGKGRQSHLEIKALAFQWDEVIGGRHNQEHAGPGEGMPLYAPGCGVRRLPG